MSPPLGFLSQNRWMFCVFCFVFLFCLQIHFKNCTCCKKKERNCHAMLLRCVAAISQGFWNCLKLHHLNRASATKIDYVNVPLVPFHSHIHYLIHSFIHSITHSLIHLRVILWFNLYRKTSSELNPLTLEEKKQIVSAIGLSKGHWFKCPRGHIYCIGECGGAMERSKCPECKAVIGGERHMLEEGNTLASEMDGAQYPAWSEQANMRNYGFQWECGLPLFRKKLSKREVAQPAQQALLGRL